MMRRTLLGFLALVATAVAQPAPAAAGSAPTPPPPPKRIPIPGITLTDNERTRLTTGTAELRADLDQLARELAAEPKWLALIPDAEIFHKAVDWALRYDEFMAPKEVTAADGYLAKGWERVAHLRRKQAPWLAATGLVVRGYRSKIDGSIQPYGLFVPETPPADTGKSTPLLVWLLGRGEKRTELAFLLEREAGPPQITPQGTLTLIPYGRFCNATKFAGEADVFEALAAVLAGYRVDENRIAVGGFSMGGGSTWHLATHFPGLWCAATPGAGFAETPIFTRALSPGREPRQPWEPTLWRQFDATGIAGNLFNVPTLAYAGALDGQKEASDLMETATKAAGVTLERFIGPDTAHKYHPETKAALTKRFEELIARGRENVPREVRFSTYTLRYAESAWLRIEGMEQHWERADVKAWLSSDNTVAVETKNVSALALQVAPTAIMIDGQPVIRLAPQGQRVLLQKVNGRWQSGANPEAGLRKRPGLTGPVDDAFVEPFLFVRPTGKPLHPETSAWIESELTAARTLWRDVFRGHAPVKSDREVTEADIAGSNLILWGDPSSNAVLRRVLAQLPVKWDAQALTFRDKTYDAKHHAPILVFPNPLNPSRYIVLNSGITFRSEGYGNNALQTAKLPDWSIVDLRTPPGPRWPGKIVDAGFFNESWK